MSQIDRPDPRSAAPPPGVHLPRPTVWPMVMALGIALAMSGIVLTPVFSVAGLGVFAVALAGWIRELRRE